ncbi:type II toxin-antitoxin system RelE/ParE family toxin [Arthrobacter sp. RAF14]|uniref:type II toxin-antitoxin system RelE/ParE family toxin n=1 Tax=Arthrobacter sp. RAF14 TaxID=3233051 RepID=UPI003F92911E
MSFRLTPSARADLSSIWDYTEEHWDARQAETYIRELHAAMERVAEDPRRGRSCDEIRAGYRKYAIGGHLIFYVVPDDGVDVVRVLHQRMDSGRQL